MISVKIFRKLLRWIFREFSPNIRTTLYASTCVHRVTIHRRTRVARVISPIPTFSFKHEPAWYLHNCFRARADIAAIRARAPALSLDFPHFFASFHFGLPLFYCAATVDDLYICITLVVSRVATDNERAGLLPMRTSARCLCAFLYAVRRRIRGWVVGFGGPGGPGGF